jgi:hypothetical protein
LKAESSKSGSYSCLGLYRISTLLQRNKWHHIIEANERDGQREGSHEKEEARQQGGAKLTLITICFLSSNPFM